MLYSFSCRLLLHFNLARKGTAFFLLTQIKNTFFITFAHFCRFMRKNYAKTTGRLSELDENSMAPAFGPKIEEKWTLTY